MPTRPKMPFLGRTLCRGPTKNEAVGLKYSLVVFRPMQLKLCQEYCVVFPTTRRKFRRKIFFVDHKVAADVTMQLYSIVRSVTGLMGKDVQKGLKHIQQRQPPVFKRHNDTINECWPDRERSWPS